LNILPVQGDKHGRGIKDGTWGGEVKQVSRQGDRSGRKLGGKNAERRTSDLISPTARTEKKKRPRTSTIKSWGKGTPVSVVHQVKKKKR